MRFRCAGRGAGVYFGGLELPAKDCWGEDDRCEEEEDARSGDEEKVRAGTGGELLGSASPLGNRRLGTVRA